MGAARRSARKFDALSVLMAAACAVSCAAPPPRAADIHAGDVRVVDVGEGWARNSVNAVVFRKNSLVTHGDMQYIAFYDPQARVVLGKRRLGSGAWELKATPYQGNALDAHNSISIMVDGAGYLHLAWDHHNSALRYARSLRPGALEMTAEMPMTGQGEASVSYPEFHRQPDGNLLFFY
ncbi:BNR-4 repeat-containing protein, partial [Roseateles sp. P5_E11]